MLALFLLVASIALADSLNPSTIAPALLLAAGKQPARALAGFTLGVFATSFAFGALLTFGPGQFLLSLVPHPDRHTRRLIEVIAGVVLLAIPAAIWLGRHRIAKHARIPEPGGRSAMTLGAGIMAVELPTAVPYFAAIAAIVGSGFAVAIKVLLLTVFNVVLVLPLLAILAVRVLAGERAERTLSRLGDWLPSHAPLILSGLLAIVGVALIGVGGIGLLRGR